MDLKVRMCSECPFADYRDMAAKYLCAASRYREIVPFRKTRRPSWCPLPVTVVPR